MFRYQEAMMEWKWFNLGSIVTLGILLAGCRPVVATPGAAAQAQAAPTAVAGSSTEPAAGTAGEQGGDEAIATIPVGNYAGAHVVFDDGMSWITNAGDGTLSHIDTSTNQVVETVKIGEIGGTYGSPWAAALGAGSLG